jgi:hypothetical protein
MDLQFFRWGFQQRNPKSTKTRKKFRDSLHTPLSLLFFPNLPYHRTRKKNMYLWFYRVLSITQGYAAGAAAC